MEINVKVVFATLLLASFSSAGSISGKYPRSQRPGRYIFIGPDNDATFTRRRYVPNPVIYSWPPVPSSKASKEEHSPGVISPRPVYSWRDDGTGWDSVGWVAVTSTCDPTDSSTHTVTVASKTTTTTTIYSTKTSTTPISTVTVTTAGGWAPGDADLSCSSSSSDVTILLEPSQDPGPYSVPSSTTTLTVTIVPTTETTTFTTEVVTALDITTVPVTSPYSVSPSVMHSTYIEFTFDRIYTSTTTSTTRPFQSTCTSTKLTSHIRTDDYSATSTLSLCPCPNNGQGCSCTSSYPTTTISIEQTTPIYLSSLVVYYGIKTSTDFTSSVLTSTSTSVVSGSTSTVPVTKTEVAPTSVVNSRSTSTYSLSGGSSLSIQAGGGDCSGDSVEPTVTSTVVESVGSGTVTITETEVVSTVKQTSVSTTTFTKAATPTTTTSTVTGTDFTVSKMTETNPICGAWTTLSTKGVHTRTRGTVWITPTVTSSLVTNWVTVTDLEVSTVVEEGDEALHVPATGTVTPATTGVTLSGTEVSYETSTITPTIDLPSATQVLLEVGCTGGTVGWSQVP